LAAKHRKLPEESSDALDDEEMGEEVTNEGFGDMRPMIKKISNSKIEVTNNETAAKLQVYRESRGYTLCAENARN